MDGKGVHAVAVLMIVFWGCRFPMVDLSSYTKGLKFFTALEEEELAAYGIKSGDKIAEIGAGDAGFARRLLQKKIPITLFINEISAAAIKKIKWTLAHDPLFLSTTSQVTAVTGTLSSTGLEGKNLNKIIIRDALHHFDRKTAMLQSIRKSLDRKGQVYLFERYKNDCAGDCCPMLLSQDGLLETMSKGGFHLMSEQPILQNGQWHYVLTFEISRW